ncbi:hypothetical protein HYDPIDRAFT_43904 [Hydnomerulius pinastri MD-312]|uniref:MIF4G domain-containing protein n=1 Tax=Hydnomerulius pinastri MD-312 TaxID=994086 RepID=A0A0C9VPQ9_9AGAM|nr:hypothetical protein HYDPIDRAFT_43904 [Hydnomerulius pinastri MD-312]
MVHNCVDWAINTPRRKLPLLLLSWGDAHVYTLVPEQFEALVALAKKKFGLETSELEFYSSCINFCSDALAEVSQDVWELVAPYIGCITVIEKSPPDKRPAAPPEAKQGSLDVSGAPTTTSSSAMEAKTTVSPAVRVLGWHPAVGGSSRPDTGAAARPDVSHMAAPKARVLASSVSGGANKIAPRTQTGGASVLNDVAPLKASANRWVSTSVGSQWDPHFVPSSPELAERKITALLNKVTWGNYDPAQKLRVHHNPFKLEYDYFPSYKSSEPPSIAQQLVAILNGNNYGGDGRTLLYCVRSLFERGIDDLERSSMYASLCVSMIDGINEELRVNGVNDAKGNPMAGGALFRKYLLDHCQAAIDGDCLSWGSAVTAVQENSADIPLDQHYADEAARRRGRGLIKFISSLQEHWGAIPDCTMHDYLKRLLRKMENPTEGDIDSLCKLLREVGKRFDTPHEAGAKLDIYFKRIKEISKIPTLCPRLQYSIQDLVELRRERWKKSCISEKEAFWLAWTSPLCEASALDSKVPQWKKFALELYKTRDLKRAEGYFKTLSVTDHTRFINALVLLALRGSKTDALVVADFFAHAAARGQCSSNYWMLGFMDAAKEVDDTVIDAPNAYSYMVTIVKRVAGVDKERGSLEKIASQVADKRRLIQLVRW